jgi:Na+/melibiose symporter-like transporter
MADGIAGPLAAAGEDARPTRPLPLRQLFDISVYWLGLTCIFTGLTLVLSGRLEYEGLVPAGSEGTALIRMNIMGAVVAAVLQPTVGAISDYTASRWGRRKPYILVGSILDVLFLIGIATSNTVLLIATFVLLLQVSSNVAQGPFQGYVPDLVPEPQVGLASAFLGIFQVLGNITVVVVGNLGVVFHQYGLATVGLGVIEVTTMLVVFFRVHEGRSAKDRAGRSWLAVARSAWGTDILGERSFLWLLGSRFFFLMAGGVLLNLSVFYLARAQALPEADVGMMGIAIGITVAAFTVISIVPSARVSDRVGRKPVIWAATGIGMVAFAILVAAPSVAVALPGAALYGIANGIFLAVDWALMTDIIPKASSGRYMGLSNVATASSGIAALAVGGVVMDIVGGPVQAGSGPRAAFAVAILAYAVAAALLVPVREPRRRRGGAAPASGSDPAAGPSTAAPAL